MIVLLFVTPTCAGVQACLGSHVACSSLPFPIPLSTDTTTPETNETHFHPHRWAVGTQLAHHPPPHAHRRSAMFRRGKKKQEGVESNTLSKSDRKAAARAHRKQQQAGRYPSNRRAKGTPFPDRTRTNGPALSLEFIGELKRKTAALRVLQLNDDSDSDDEDVDQRASATTVTMVSMAMAPSPAASVTQEDVMMNTTPTGRKARWRILRRGTHWHGVGCFCGSLLSCAQLSLSLSFCVYVCVKVCVCVCVCVSKCVYVWRCA
jgi:hypothetical protein